MHQSIQLDTLYRVYRNGRQTDQLRFIDAEENTAWAVRWEYDEPQEIHLPNYLREHTLKPAGVP